ncbi:MAG: hypothetical protein A3G41_04900 [Elusimicrobia bacterium RIFCSPLOWO2_12_FULL_59_9]|nr:MAG: hypothetical protein A3G41_04900 [Elusimicrobia bacterium RIFCSPLOWO2_12_FULL_59_9]
MRRGPPRILIAPNAFKSCLSAGEAAEALARGFKRGIPRSRLERLPIADGGDGLMEVLLQGCGGRAIAKTVTGPMGRKIRSSFAILGDGRTAVVEMALASGLKLVPERSRDPMIATSYGTGELIAAAISSGARLILVGLGGSASNDGGAGMAQALGARLLDRNGKELPLGASPLLRLFRIDAAGLHSGLKGAKLLGVTDVENPLLGPKGSAAVYGPQKGATPAMVSRLEKSLSNYAAVIARDLGVRVAGVAGAGAAGGLGAGLAGFLGAELRPGAELVLKMLRAERRIRRADVVVSGEGRLDLQSFFGKGPVFLARMAKRLKKQVILICGGIDPAARSRLRREGIEIALSLSDLAGGPGEATRHAKRWLAQAAAQAARRL